jgi:hypothetical protein
MVKEFHPEKLDHFCYYVYYFLDIYIARKMSKLKFNRLIQVGIKLIKTPVASPLCIYHTTAMAACIGYAAYVTKLLAVKRIVELKYQ